MLREEKERGFWSLRWFAHASEGMVPPSSPGRPSGWGPNSSRIRAKEGIRKRGRYLRNKRPRSRQG